MAALRHVLTTNTWEMECPICGRFVPITRSTLTGDLPFPRHRAFPSRPFRICAFRITMDWTSQWQPTGLTSFGPVS
jgi:hypothetical protein